MISNQQIGLFLHTILEQMWKVLVYEKSLGRTTSTMIYPLFRFVNLMKLIFHTQKGVEKQLVAL